MKKALTVWVPTGDQESGFFRSALRVLFNPVFLFGIAVIAFVVMFYFNLASAWRVWTIPISSIGLAVVIIIYRLKTKEKPLISKQQAIKFNNFAYVSSWLPNRYLNYIDLTSERTQNDKSMTIALYRQIGEAINTLGLFDETGESKVNKFSGKEFIRIVPVDYYTDLMIKEGIGYVLFEPSVSLIAKIHSVDEKIISRTVRETGLNNWTVERVNYDDDVFLFILKDETVSRAFDFSGV